MSDTIRILIADDHAIVRRGLGTLIEATPNLELVGEAVDGEEAIRKTRMVKPDVIVMDLLMPKVDGIEAIKAIISEDSQAKILVLTSFSEDENVFPAIRAGAAGYRLKSTSPRELVSAIQDIHLGKPSLDPTIAQKVLNEVQNPSDLRPTTNPLTPRELDALKLVAQGLSNRGIAEQLVLSEGTVRVHVSNILKKLHLASRTQAALFALREGIVDL